MRPARSLQLGYQPIGLDIAQGTTGLVGGPAQSGRIPECPSRGQQVAMELIRIGHAEQADLGRFDGPLMVISTEAPLHLGMGTSGDGDLHGGHVLLGGRPLEDGPGGSGEGPPPHQR
jgi:hypothetical protein